MHQSVSFTYTNKSLIIIRFFCTTYIKQNFICQGDNNKKVLADKLLSTEKATICFVKDEKLINHWIPSKVFYNFVNIVKFHIILYMTPFDVPHFKTNIHVQYFLN